MIFRAEKEADLGRFDAWHAYSQFGYEFSVFVEETGESVYPIFYKDDDGYPTGFEGWGSRPND